MGLKDEKIGHRAPGLVRAVVEIPRGGRERLEYDPRSGRFWVAKLLQRAAPANYGWIPETYADDGEEADVVILCEDILPPGSVRFVRPVGIYQRENRDHKVLAVLVGDPTFGHIRALEQVPQEILDAVSQFWRRLEGEHFEGRRSALAFIGRSHYRFRRRQRGTPRKTLERHPGS